jgi:hypothetical protein
METITLPEPAEIVAVSCDELQLVRAALLKLPDHNKYSLGFSATLNDRGFFMDDMYVARQVLKEIDEALRHLMHKADILPRPYLGATIDISGVPTGYSQRNVGWHIDGLWGVTSEAVVVSDVLPTEFLIGCIRRPRIVNLMKRKLYNSVSGVKPVQGLDRLSDDSIVAAGLQIQSAQPYTMTHFDRVIHRSPVNHTGHHIDRTWVRFSW